MCCWTQFCSCHFEATCVLQVVYAVEIPALEGGGEVNIPVGETCTFKPSQAEYRAEMEFCADAMKIQITGRLGRSSASTNSHQALRK